MEKTKEQAQADMLLGEAIENCIKAYLSEQSEDHEFTLTDFVVLTAVQRISDEGVIITRYPMYMRDGDMPWYKILGLINQHKLYAEVQSLDTQNNG